MSAPKICLAAFLILSAVIRVVFIEGALPYSRHVDEQAIIPHAARILKTGDLEPSIYVYPSLPIYLTSIFQGLGYLNEKAHGRMSQLAEFDGRVYPYFVQPSVMLFPKLLFAGFSVLVLWLGGILAAQITGWSWALIVAPLFISVSDLFFYHSWLYINLDIAASLGVLGALIYLVHAWPKDSWTHKAIIPGILCGLTAACKYPHGLIVLPFLIAIMAISRSKFFKYAAGLFASLLLTFVVSMPYSVLRWRHFLEELEWQKNIYKNGHFGFTVPSGLPHLMIQLRQFVEEYGMGLCLLSLVGVAWLVYRHRKLGLALISYPVGYLIYFCTNKANITRTLLPVYVMLAVFATVGAGGLTDWLKARFLALKRPVAVRAAPWAVSLLILATLPWAQIKKTYAVQEDSRNRATTWIQTHLPKGSELIIPSEMQMDLRPWTKDYKTQEIPFNTKEFDPKLVEKMAQSKTRDIYFLVPEFSFDERWPALAKQTEAMNRRFDTSKAIKKFEGEYGVLIMYQPPVAWGNPRFAIHKGLEPAQP
ncbi:hypothetical protein WDW37_03435 [Bdellovibrionota bacterium FG-1]